MAVLGIDLGTTNSLAAYWADGQVHLITNEDGQVLFPSVVSYVGAEGLVVGPEAKERILTHRADTANSFKRFMGTDKKYHLGKQDYSPMELSAMVLERIRRNAEYFLKEEIEEAIITVPAYFNDKQRSDTKKAAKIAGLKVERLINEPSAAALAYRMKYGEKDMTLLVFDFGGGTLDLSYVECFDNVIEIVAVAGDNYLGGDDIDRLIAEYFCRENGLAGSGAPENDRLSGEDAAGDAGMGKGGMPGELTCAEYAAVMQGAEAAKCRLEQEEEVEMTVEIGGKTCRARLDNDILFQICMPLFAKIKKLFVHILNDARARVSELDDLIMVGGSSRLTVVRRFLKELLGKEPVVLGDTDKVVAMGAGVYAGIRMRREDIRDMLLTDVCPFTLGVETWRSRADVQGCLLPMIERNSTLPASECKRLVTLHDYQDAIRIGIYQGEEYFAKDNLFLSELTIPVYPKPAGQEWVDVYFTYDINGILYVEVANSQDMRNHVLLSNQDLSKEELERYQKEMQKLMLPPIMQEENQRLLASLQEYYENSTGPRREEIGYFINWVVAGLNSRRIHRVRRVVEEAKRQIERWEAWKGQEEEWLFDGELKMGFPEDEEMEDWNWEEGSDGEGVYEDERDVESARHSADE